MGSEHYGSHEIRLEAGQAYLSIRQAAQILKKYGLTRMMLRTLEDRFVQKGQLIRRYRPSECCGFVYEVHLADELKSNPGSANFSDPKLEEIDGNTASNLTQGDFKSNPLLIDNTAPKKRGVLSPERGEREGINMGGPNFRKFGLDYLLQNPDRHRAEFERRKPSFKTLPNIIFADYDYVYGYIATSRKSDFVEKMLSKDSFGVLDLIAEYDAWRQTQKLAPPFDNPVSIIRWAEKFKKFQI